MCISTQWQNYAKKATETIKSYGGQPLVRGGKYKCLEGTDYPRTVIWEFPNYDMASFLRHESWSFY